MKNKEKIMNEAGYLMFLFGIGGHKKEIQQEIDSFKPGGVRYVRERGGPMTRGYYPSVVLTERYKKDLKSRIGGSLDGNNKAKS